MGMFYSMFKLLKCTGFLKRLMATQTKDIMDSLKSKKLINCVGDTVNVTKALQDKSVLLFYFSASWCNPCKELLPKVRKVYSVAKKRKQGLEIIYVSSDTEEDIFLKYFKTKHGGWYAVSFGDNLAEELRQFYSVTAIPVIYVVNANNGNVISKTGRKDIETVGENVLVKWFQ